jgi:hypothetical protein
MTGANCTHGIGADRQTPKLAMVEWLLLFVAEGVFLAGLKGGPTEREDSRGRRI